MVLNQQNVELVLVENNTEELSDKIFYECSFCGKREGFCHNSRKLYEKLSGDDFFCAFCLRNGFNTKNKRNVLALSFRAIAGYYYYALNQYPVEHYNVQKQFVYVSQILDYVRSHEETGLKNPLFSYDPQTMLWFVDFARVGRDKKKIKFDEVSKTIANILVCFNLNFHVHSIKVGRLYSKYVDSMKKFYTSRYRPEKKRHLIPTLQGCAEYTTIHKNFNLEDTRYFTLDKISLV